MSLTEKKRRLDESSPPGKLPESLFELILQFVGPSALCLAVSRAWHRITYAAMWHDRAYAVPVTRMRVTTWLHQLVDQTLIAEARADPRQFALSADGQFVFLCLPDTVNVTSRLDDAGRTALVGIDPPTHLEAQRRDFVDALVRRVNRDPSPGNAVALLAVLRMPTSLLALTTFRTCATPDGSKTLQLVLTPQVVPLIRVKALRPHRELIATQRFPRHLIQSFYDRAFWMRGNDTALAVTHADRTRLLMEGGAATERVGEGFLHWLICRGVCQGEADHVAECWMEA